MLLFVNITFLNEFGLITTAQWNKFSKKRWIFKLNTLCHLVFVASQLTKKIGVLLQTRFSNKLVSDSSTWCFYIFFYVVAQYIFFKWPISYLFLSLVFLLNLVYFLLKLCAIVVFLCSFDLSQLIFLDFFKIDFNISKMDVVTQWNDIINIIDILFNYVSRLIL